MQELTVRQRAVFEFLEYFERNNDNFPSYELVADYFGFKSKYAVLKHLSALKRKGYIEKVPVMPSKYRFARKERE